VNGESAILPAADDDTIEFVLSPEQLAGLWEAAEAAEVAAPASVAVIPTSPAPVAAAVVPSPMTPVFPSPPPPLLKGKPASRFGHWHETPIAKMAANTVAFVAFAWWSVAQLAGQPQHQPQATVTAAVRPITLVHQPVPAATSAQQPGVQVVNPFDAKEVFQFPAGTSDAESREKVAQILLQRARERQSKWEHIRPGSALRTASLSAVRKSVQGPEEPTSRRATGTVPPIRNVVDLITTGADKVHSGQ
jgi:hypothetical protein